MVIAVAVIGFVALALLLIGTILLSIIGVHVSFQVNGLP
jgi:hypothetical protein